MDTVASRELSSSAAKLLKRVMGGRSDANISFDKLRRLLRDLGFRERITGSHHVFGGAGISRPLNLQPADGGKCKPYELRQVRRELGSLLLRDEGPAACGARVQGTHI